MKRLVTLVLLAAAFATGIGIALADSPPPQGPATTTTMIPFSTDFTVTYTVPPPSTVTVTVTSPGTTSTTESTTTSTTSASTTTTTPGPPPPPPPNGFPRYGIQDGGYINDGHLTASQAAFYLDEAQAAGAQLYRFGYRSGQDTTASSGAVSNDAMMQKLAARGLEPLLILGGPTNPPSAATCQAAAARYPLVRFFEVWNEPNIHGYTGTSYEPYLKACYLAVKAANPRASVLIGGLSYAYQGGGSTSPIRFMEQLYDAGGGPYFDLANVHPYNDPADHWFTSGVSCREGGGSLWDQTWGDTTYCPTGFIRQLMDSRGDGEKPIAATEVGDRVGKVSEAKQATIIQHALQDPRPAFAVVYSNDDLEVPGFGLHRSDGTRRPSFAAFQAVTG